MLSPAIYAIIIADVDAIKPEDFLPNVPLL
jgi:hypothetical protein